MLRSLRSFSLIGFVGLTVLGTACSKSSDEPPVVAKGAALLQAQDCEDLLSRIQADAIARLDQQVSTYKKWTFAGGGRGGIGVDDGAGDGGAIDGGPVATDGGAEPPSSPAPGSGTGNGSAEGDSGGGPDEFSETNTQVAGVDEADIVKTDGERIYLLHGNDFFLLDSWPADETRVLGSTPIEGNAFELFVDDGRAIVYSTVYFSGGPSKGVPGGAADGGWDGIDCYGCSQNNFTKISTFDVTGDAPVLEREILVEGYYVSGRRHGDVVRTIVQGGFRAVDLYYPDVSFYDSFGREKSQERIADELDAWRDRIALDIQSTQLSDWIPRRYERMGDGWEELSPECDGYFVPAPGLVHVGVTQVVTFDVKKAETPRVVAVLGGAETVYANHDVLVLGQANYSWETLSESSTRTVLHQFRLDAAKTSYEASGFLPGYLHNQFSLDESEGVIRASTTEDIRIDLENDPWNWTTENRVYTLQKSGKDLEVLGKTAAFGEEMETIFATRFLGDRGYVVTFRRTDPLVVVDLADPAEPRVVGELHIPGFSDYIHPLGEHKLLTIGQDADGDGFQNGVALQIFDVDDPNDPKLVHKTTYGGFSYSEANWNHKAFTFQADHFGEDQGLLLFPITLYEPEFRSGLEVVKVSVADGFEKLGSLDHTALLQKNCVDYQEYGAYCYYNGADMRRGLLIGGEEAGSFVYAISYGGLTVHPLDDLATTSATVELPSPSFGYFYGGDVSPGTPGEPLDGGVDGVGGGAAQGPEDGGSDSGSGERG